MSNHSRPRIKLPDIMNSRNKNSDESVESNSTYYNSYKNKRKLRSYSYTPSPDQEITKRLTKKKKDTICINPIYYHVG